MLIEKLLKNTKFKNDAVAIARQLAKVGIENLDLLADAPGRLRSATIWGHSLSAVIDAIRAAAKEAASEKTTKPLDETPRSEPPKAVGGIK
jgi:hypothetical protein